MALLPIAMVVAVVLWLIFSPLNTETAVGLGLSVVTTLVLGFLNNAYQLLRIRCLTISSLFILLTAICAPIHGWAIEQMVCGLLFLIYMTGLMTSYQASRPQVGTFMAMTSLSALTMFVPMAIWLVPVSLIVTAATLQTLTLRTLLAMLFGLLLPYELWIGWHFYQGGLMAELNTWSEAILAIRVPAIESGTTWQGWLSDTMLNMPAMLMLLLVLFGLVSIVHFFRTSFNDKIRTRMFHIAFILHWIVLAVLLLFSCGSTSPLVVMLLVCGSPGLARYLVFSKGWVANIFFCIFVLSCLFLALRPL